MRHGINAKALVARSGEFARRRIQYSLDDSGTAPANPGTDGASRDF